MAETGISVKPHSVEPRRELAAAEHSLCNNEQRLREILGAAPVAFISIDAEGLILDWNAQAELVFGWPASDALGRKLTDTVLPPAVRDACERDLTDTAASDDPPPELCRRMELTAIHQDGHEFPIEMTVSRLSAGDSHLFHVFARDMSAQMEADLNCRYAEEQLAHQILHDPLTGLPNRTLLIDRIGHALSLAQRHSSLAALLYVDIDNFKLINDSFGHQVGDELLVQVVRRLQDVLRASDTLARFAQNTLARVGGDEFVVLCESLSSEHNAIDIAERIATALREPFALADERLFVQVSVGIALTGPGTTPGSLIRDADTALHRAKERGGSRSELFDPETRARVLDRVRKESELREAIQRDELRLFYQPIVSVLDGGIIGAEALLRWQHPERGLVLPADFIPLAEETGLIVPFGRWVLEQATAQLAQWTAKSGYRAPLRISVNVSARQLVEDDLVGFITGLFEARQLQPPQLTLEVTESILMKDTDERVGILKELQALGVRLALDDFGTGYSSLGYLRRLPFDVLKLDRSFISGLDQTSTDPHIAAAVIEVARALTMSVIAEGVERPEQLVCLRRLGCHYAQGFYFAEPLPEGEAAAMMDAQPALIPLAR